MSTPTTRRETVVCNGPIRRMALSLCLLVCSLQALPGAVEILTWADGLKRFRTGTMPDGAALVIGRMESQLVRALRDGSIQSFGIPVIVLSNMEEVENPFTRRMGSARNLISLYTGVLRQRAAGSIIFLGPDMIPRPMVSLKQLEHRMIPERVSLYFDYVRTGSHARTSLEKFATIRRQGPVITAMIQEQVKTAYMAKERYGQSTQDARITVLKYFSRPLKGDAVPVGRLPDGSPVLPRQLPGQFIVITRDPSAPVFLAQMRDLWLTFTEERGSRVAYPNLVVLGPKTGRYDALHSQGIRFTQAEADPRTLAGSSPRLLMSGGPQGSVVEFSGYMPGTLMASLLLRPKENQTDWAPDIAIGEQDFKALPAASTPRQFSTGTGNQGE